MSASETTYIRWQEGDVACVARWRSARWAAPPLRVVLADDSLSADAAYRLASAGTAMLWRGDYQNARQLVQALARRIELKTERKQLRGAQLKQRRQKAADAQAADIQTTDLARSAAAATPAQRFHAHRQAQAQRAHILGMVLVQLDAQHTIALRRAPDVATAVAEAWAFDPPEGSTGSGAGHNAGSNVDTAAGGSVVSLRELLGLIGAHEWRKTGVELPVLAAHTPNPQGLRIHPHHGVYSPVRGEYLQLLADAPLPAAMLGPSGRPRADAVAFDIGTGTGVLALLLARRGVPQVLATDNDPRALACAKANVQLWQAERQVQVLPADMFAPGRAALVVCNPPWLPARAGSAIERSVYDEGGRMLNSFLAGLAEHLAPGGEGWLVLSDLAEHLQLRSRAELLQAIAQAGLQVLGRTDTRPVHPKSQKADDPLAAERAAEVTSLWRLAPLG